MLRELALVARVPTPPLESKPPPFLPELPDEPVVARLSLGPDAPLYSP